MHINSNTDVVFDWTFPLPRTHTGILQGNGTLSAIIWGEENVLKITINRADFWDHQGGLAWNEGMTFKEITQLLTEENEKELYRRETITLVPAPTD